MAPRATRRHTPPAGGAKSDLVRFPRPTLAVDVAVLTVPPGDWAGAPSTADGLAVLLVRRDGSTEPGTWALPGSMARERERLADAVLRTLHDKCGIEGLAPRQLAAFDDPDRDERGWVISMAHADAVPFDRLLAALEARHDLTVAPVDGQAAVAPVEAADVPDLELLPFDHAQIVRLAVDDLRERYRRSPDPAGLIDEPFTLLELRRLHEAVLGEPLQKDTFRRQMAPQLEELDELSDGTVGRPARLHRHRS